MLSKVGHWLICLQVTVHVLVLYCTGFVIDDQHHRPTFTLMAADAEQTYKVLEWTDNDIMQLNFEMDTLSEIGQVATIRLAYTEMDEEALVLNLYVKNGFVNVRFGAEGDRRRMLWVLNTDVSDGQRHNFSLLLKPLAKTLSIIVGNVKDATDQISFNFIERTSTKGNIELTLGYSGEKSGHVDGALLACISNFRATVGKNQFRIATFKNVHSNSNGQCKNACMKSSCSSPSKCINYYSFHICDCYQSSESQQCDGYSMRVSLDDRSNVIKYKVDRRIKRIGLAFKTEVDDDQVLVDLPASHVTGSFKMERVKVIVRNMRRIVIVVNDKEYFYEIPTKNFFDGKWHHVTMNVNLNQNQMEITLDRLNVRPIALHLAEKHFDITEDDFVTFGGSLTENDAENNFHGCMSDLFVNYDSVLYGIANVPLRKAYNPKITFGCRDMQIAEDDKPLVAYQEVDLQTHEGNPPIVEEAQPEHQPENVPEHQPEHAPEHQPEPAPEHQPEHVPEHQHDHHLTTISADAVKTVEHIEPLYEKPPEPNDPLPIIPAVERDDSHLPHHVGDIVAETSVAPHEVAVTEKDFWDWGQPRRGAAPGVHVIHDPVQPSTERPKVTCEQLDCKNGGKCEHEPLHDAKCVCAHGFVGESCIFSSLPNSCDELYQMGERRNGVFKIDPVGSSAPNHAHVNCVMDEENQRGLTIVGHNFPNMTQVRNKTMIDVTYQIKYRFVEEEGLRRLVDRSLKCRQQVRYDCSQAPLQFMMSATFFESPYKKDPFARIGLDKGKCPCAALSPNRCSGATKNVNNTCNCDSSESMWLSDEGTYLGELAPLTKLTFLQFKDRDSNGKMTLGDFICEGSLGFDDIVQIKSSKAQLELPSWKGESLSFWFRTSVADAVLVNQKASDDTRYFTVSIKQAHTVEVKFNLGMSDVKLDVVSQKPINDSVWHKVFVEQVSGVLRASLDDRNAFYKLQADEKLTVTTFAPNPMFIGGNSNNPSVRGYVGCIRHVVEDRKVVLLNQIAKDKNIPESDVVSGCQDQCHQNPCKNNARCVEDYASVSYQCQCVNPRVHLGTDCSQDINVGSDISFHNPKTSYLNLTNLSENPVQEDIVFSFMTDQPEAMLLYSHDQYYNFIQVHLWGGNKITLTVNYDHTVHQCTVVSLDKEFDTMNWTQVLVDNEQDYIALLANDLFCHIDGHRRLSDSYVEAWDNTTDVRDVVVPPRSPFKPKDTATVEVNTILFMGGVPNLGVIGRTRRQAFYQTYLPNLLGAMRGLRVGDLTVNMQQQGVRSSDGSVRLGSHFGCDFLNCENGGQCAVAWFDPHEPARCDCSSTSYSGVKCNEDHGVTFDGQTYVELQMRTVLDTTFLPSARPFDSMRFAFSTSSTSDDQVLVVLDAGSELNLKIVLKGSNGHLFVDVTEPEQFLTKSVSIPGIFNDGNRHFVFTKFSNGKILVRVDGQHAELDSRLTLERVKVATIGGAQPDVNTNTKSYQGCMSNFMFEFPSDRRSYSMSPLIAATTTTDKLSPFTKVVPDGSSLPTAQCANFKVVVVPTTNAQMEMMPPWDPPLTTSEYKRIVVVSPAAEQSSYGIAIGLIVLLIVLLIIIGLFLYYKKCIKKKTPTPPPPRPTDPKGTVVEKGQYPKETDPFIKGQPAHIIPAGQRLSHNTGLNPNQGELQDADLDLDRQADPDPYHNGGYKSDNRPPSFVDFPPPPTEDEIRAMSPPANKKSPYTGSFTYGVAPNAGDAPTRKNPEGTVPVIVRVPSSRRPPVPASIPKV